jgi:hypothetical protein
MGMTMVNGMMIPDRYLAHNPRPRYMIFLYGPEDFAPGGKWRGVSTFESISFRIQHQHDFSTVLFILKHPNEFFSWLELGIRLGLSHLHSAPYQDAQLRLREPHRGQFPLHNPTLTRCKEKVDEIKPNPQWIRGLRDKYGVDGTRVLVDVVPVPDCDPSYSYYKDKFSSLIDNKLERYPVSDYVTEGRLHMNVTGSNKLSTAIGNQVAALERNH